MLLYVRKAQLTAGGSCDGGWSRRCDYGKIVVVMVGTTSTTLLKAIGADADSVRWIEFVDRYRPLVEAFLRSKFDFTEIDDIVQETFAAVVKALPSYRYDPDRSGCFRNWLMGIARHKAEEQLRRNAKEMNKTARYAGELSVRSENSFNVDDWRRDAMEVALRQLLADDSYSDQSKRIFVRTAVNGESPESVAELFQTTRNNVDQIRNRLTKRLRELVRSVIDVR